MEALLFIFAEILVACLAPVLAIVGAFFAALLELLAALIGLLFSGGFGSRAAKRKTPASGAARAPLIPRKAVHWLAGILAAGGVIGVVASVVLFQPILRTVMDAAAQKAGMEISYDTATGSLLSGRVELQGIVLRREVGTGPGFDLAVERAEADVDLWSLLSAEPRIELARVDGVTGFVSPPARDGSPERTEGAERPVRAKRAFRADLAQVSALDIEIRPAGGTPYALRIDKAEVAPFRSRVALFDLLFRSNLQAEIAGQPLLVETRDITEFGRETRWRFEDVEAARLKLIVAKAPLTWLDSGTFSAVVDDRWSLSEDWVDMDWRITLADVSINAPENAKAGEKVLAGALKKLVAARGGNASFGYRLRLDQNEIRNLRSGDLDQFWDVVLSGVLAGGAHGADEAGGPDVSEETPGRLRGALDRMRSLLGDGDK